ncbi:MAG: polysaccharide deacetylase family protein [Alphaproteobacteria bacterium]|nr:polysaccharide deacetylase family protein [Alphaproteobacteria bacterium]
MSNPRIPYELAHKRPALTGPHGKTLIVHLVVNVESWQFDQAMPRKIITAPHGAEQIPDIPNFSWAEYGMRVGMSRMLRLFDERGLPASTSINAGVIDNYPACATAMLEAGWEFIGHGIHQRSMQSESDEAGLIQAALDKLERFTGMKTRGWLSPGLKESYDTPDILKAAGIDYVCDWVLDDLPTWMDTKHGRMIAMPYNVEVNDSIIFAVEKHGSREMFTRLRDTIACFEEEMGEGAPRVLALGLHPHLIGVPHRIGYLKKMLDLLVDRGDTVFMTGSQIADWFVAASRGD